jgi:hypothetical protein
MAASTAEAQTMGALSSQKNKVPMLNATITMMTVVQDATELPWPGSVEFCDMLFSFDL